MFSSQHTSTNGAAKSITPATIAPDQATGTPTVYVYGAPGYLHAMDASSGTNVWAPRRWRFRRPR